MEDTLINEEELVARLAALVDLTATIDHGPAADLHRSHRRWARPTLAVAGVAAAAMTLIVLIGAIDTDTTVTTDPRAEAPVRPPVEAKPFPSYPDDVTAGAGAKVEPGGLLVSKTSRSGSTELQASGVAVHGAEFDLWTAGSEPVLIDDVNTASNTGLAFQLEVARWPDRIEPGAGLAVPYDLICEEWHCGEGEQAVTLRIRGHVNGGPELDAFVITFGALLQSPTATACPNARQSFERPRTVDQSADGLPATGTSTLQAAQAAQPNARQDYGAIDSEIVEVAGQAWTRRANGDVEIVPEQLFAVRLTVPSESDCPHAPAFWTVPLMFQYPVTK